MDTEQGLKEIPFLSSGLWGRMPSPFFTATVADERNSPAAGRAIEAKPLFV
jgi:hypothetical protein